MNCSLISDPDCLQALQAFGSPQIPTTTAGFESAVQSSGLANAFTNIVSNIHPFGSNGGSVTSNGQLDGGASQISFILSRYLTSLCKSARVSGSTALLDQLENRIDEIWARNDESLHAAGFTMPDLTGTIGPVVPYNELAAPPSYPLNTPHKGWSRVAYPFFNASDPNQNTARLRIEPLTDSIILAAILDGLKCLDECRPISAAKRAQWITCAEAIVDAHATAWQSGPIGSIDPLCTGTSSTLNLSGFVDNFDKIYPLNQQAVTLQAAILLDNCRGTAEYKSRASQFINSVNDHQFYIINGQDAGWFYVLRCNCAEIAEDWSHTPITFGFLKTAFMCGVPGAEALLQRMADSLKANAYQGNGDFAWYNDGNLGAGTLANVQSSGAYNPPYPGSTCNGNYSSGGSGDDRFQAAIAFSNLPPSVAATCASQIAQINSAYLGAAGGQFDSHQGLEARMCLAQGACLEPVAGNFFGSCIDCQSSTYQNGLTVPTGTPTTLIFDLVNVDGDPVTAGVDITPANLITGLSHIGNGRWQATFETGFPDTYLLSITTPGCTNDCPFTITVEGTIQPDCIDCTASDYPATIDATTGTPQVITLSLVSNDGNPVTAGVSVSPTTHIDSVVHQGNGEWLINFLSIAPGEFLYSITTPGCTNDCPLLVNVTGEPVNNSLLSCNPLPYGWSFGESHPAGNGTITDFNVESKGRPVARCPGGSTGPYLLNGRIHSGSAAGQFVITYTISDGVQCVDCTRCIRVGGHRCSDEIIASEEKVIMQRPPPGTIRSCGDDPETVIFSYTVMGCNCPGWEVEWRNGQGDIVGYNHTPATSAERLTPRCVYTGRWKPCEWKHGQPPPGNYPTRAEL